MIFIRGCWLEEMWDSTISLEMLITLGSTEFGVMKTRVSFSLFTAGS